MTALLTVVALVTVVVAVSALARRFGVLAPILLLVAGIVLSLIPGVPHIDLDPEIVLTWILPPLLYVAAVNTSVQAFRVNLRPILLLAVGLVVFTALSVGYALHLVLPAVPLAAAVALGAVVAPPDAVSASAIARRVGLPRRQVAILEGESLINDATALVIFGVAVSAATGRAVSAGDIGLNAALATVGGVAVGAVGAVVFGALHRRITQPLLDNAVSLIVPFVVYAAGVSIHASGVVAVVITGLSLGHRYPILMSAASRLQMEAFWRMVSFLLEGVVFVLVGLQMRQTLDQLRTPVGTVALATVVVLVTLILARFVWMYPATYLTQLLPRVRARDAAPHPRVPTLLAWAGMRGVVTLATALALPATLAHGARYPRDLFVFLAFATIVVTLLMQGMTLPAVARWLRIEPDDPKDDLLAEAAVQQAASRAARERLEKEIVGQEDELPADVVERLRGKIDLRANIAWERLGGRRRETPTEAYSRLRAAMLEAERDVFRLARDEGRIPEEVLRDVQRDLDLEESLMRGRK
ncbi:Na+/H+ antiporter [Rugosimonospora acidiphila]|uniref:Na+/H+ antiporter n=1 Tax=Rugosimonospora acidiphila TaxID=556531 RepID=UPI0031ECE5EF